MRYLLFVVFLGPLPVVRLQEGTCVGSRGPSGLHGPRPLLRPGVFWDLELGFRISGVLLNSWIFWSGAGVSKAIGAEAFGWGLCS